MGQGRKAAMVEYRRSLDALAETIWQEEIDSIKKIVDDSVWWEHRGRMSTKGVYLEYIVAWMLDGRQATVGVKRRLLRRCWEEIPDLR